MSKRRPYWMRDYRGRVCGGSPGPEFDAVRCHLGQHHASDHEAAGDGWRWAWPRLSRSKRRAA